ncbi:hypothetical protein B4U79_17168 [Dinothrombium tinctorium]|uniref:MD-2-related lipid-recognition domain-containing protein n=1 Tax=Dinothrombium tinctorium TaxID=1965070 RepID=A0A3S3P141_9ACAR|nr:hypothetical protein B4U79_17168 [Dinothrombium tinctorium]
MNFFTFLFFAIIASIESVRWSDCGGENAIGVLNDVQLEPNPIKAGNYIKAGAKVQLYRQFPNDTIGKLEMWKVYRVFGLIRFNIPFVCVGERCKGKICDLLTIPRVCEEVQKINSRYSLNVTCDCNTFAPGHYQAYDYDYLLPSVPTAFAWIASGDYYVKGQLLAPDGKQLGCAQGEGFLAV